VSIVSFARRLRANTATARSLNDELEADHGITIEQYEILSRIARTPTLRMREGDLSDPPLVTAASIEHVLGELEQGQLVDRSAEGGARVVALRDEGHETIRAVRSSGSPQLDQLLGLTSLPSDEGGL
jgi:DNA-binding MarR family transcriptional regulator